MTGLKQLIISPPFGNYLRLSHASRVFGTYTSKPRPGLFWQAIKTIRPLSGGGWRNKIGLRNPGIEHAKNPSHAQNIISIAALQKGDWSLLADNLQTIEQAGHIFGFVELNISCPNKDVMLPDRNAISNFKPWQLIAKLPPHTDSLKLMEELHNYGCNYFHLSNTLPSPRGGISGPQLQSHSLRLVEQARQRFGPEIKIIGGGGIYSPLDAERFKSAGADHFSISSACFNPIRLYKLIRHFDAK